MKKISTLLAAVAVAAAANSASAETVYCMPGAYQGDWSLEKNILTDNGDGTYSQHLDQLEGDFKIVRYELGSPNWDSQWGSNGSGIKAGEPYIPAFKNGPDPANIVLAGKSTILKDVTVTVTPGADNQITLLLTAGEVIEQGDIWYLVGETTGWNFPAKNQFKKGEGDTFTFTYEGSFTAGFKPVKNGSWSQAYVISEPMELGKEYTLDGPADTQTNCTLAVQSVENPVFTLVDNGSTVTLKITAGGSGIEAVEADAVNGEAVYYNLQGQRVANPEKGLYIRLQGGKATKVAL